MPYYMIDYVPVTTIQRSPTVSEPALDYLNARYIKAFRSVVPDRIHTITFKDAGRLDLVCNQYYDNRSDLLTVLARYNKIINILDEVYVGREILIPLINALEEALDNTNAVEVIGNSYITLR